MSVSTFVTMESTGNSAGFIGEIVISIEGTEYYTAGEACSALGVKLATLYAYVNRGLITSYRQGFRRERLYQRSEIDGLLTVTPVERSTASAEIPAADTWASEL